mmetsp:Transcript_6797/g.19682  ORF Transcript_6797/g.19682 Transcript_6797/m.19682 type:complete len:243 (-) Transcript_6797:107-835(-)
MFGGGRGCLDALSRKLFKLGAPERIRVDTFSTFVISTIHITFLSVSLGNADWYTTLLALAADVVMNHSQLPFVLGISRQSFAQEIAGVLKRLVPFLPIPARFANDRSSVTTHRCQNTVVLLINEVSESLMPLGYTILYVVCYFGRNRQGMAGVGVTMWHLEKQDIWDFLRNMMIILVLDMGTMIYVFYVLRNLDPFRVLAYLGETQGPFVMILSAFTLYHQFCILIISCGMDFSFTMHEAAQ